MKMLREELVIREIIGPGRGDTVALCCAVEITEQLLFEEKKYSYMSDIRVTRDIYTIAARRLGRTIKSTARQIQRTSERCWYSMDNALRLRYIGKTCFPEGAPSTRDMIFYLAFYCYCHEPYYQVLRKEVGR
ncbi:MAG: hypothetical protein LUH19_08960 [Lachnospiraceae bacterium]|nr:hypothetical protein [Lachnospiraceae bacterium]